MRYKSRCMEKKKTIGSIPFYVYASCKNGNKKVNENAVLAEIGRIVNLS